MKVAKTSVYHLGLTVFRSVSESLLSACIVVVAVVVVVIAVHTASEG